MGDNCEGGAGPPQAPMMDGLSSAYPHGSDAAATFVFSHGSESFVSPGSGLTAIDSAGDCDMGVLTQAELYARRERLQ